MQCLDITTLKLSPMNNDRFLYFNLQINKRLDCPVAKLNKMDFFMLLTL